MGASANALLQSQIPGGWFQTAFQFSNEPSTNYKIITATSSNLRVTYVAPPCAVLPIELLSFDATCEGGKVNLIWQAASQKNNDFFTIERTADGINYENLGTVAGAGNTSQSQYYSFIDSKPLGKTSYYSLKQTDFNGQSKVLNLIAVNCDGSMEFAIHPNPGTGEFIINGLEKDSEIVITDLLGQIVFQTKIILEGTDSDNYQIDLSEQLNGIYFIHTLLNNVLTSKKIVISK